MQGQIFFKKMDAFRLGISRLRNKNYVILIC